MKRAVIYTRISRDREGTQVGVDRQEADCRRLAHTMGCEITRVYSDNDIGASRHSRKKRPAFEDLMRLVESGQVGTILAYSNSRLTRRPLELERLIAAHDRTGVKFHTVVSGDDDLSKADGRMVARIKASVDAAESDRISERTRAGKQDARDRGLWPGGWRAYGLTGKAQDIVPEEAAIIEEVATKLLDGRSVLSLVRELNERNVPTSAGGRWTARSLCRVVERWHPSIPVDVTEAVRLLLSDPNRKTTPGPQRRWMLSGLAYCAVCGGSLTGSASSIGSGRGTYPAYRCKTGKHVVISAVSLDAYATAIVVARLSRPDTAGLFARPKADLTGLRREARQLRTRLDSLADDISLDERTLTRRTAALRKRLLDVQAGLTAAATSGPLSVFDGTDPEQTWAGLDVERRAVVIDALMRVTIHQGARGVVARKHRWRADLPAFDPRRVHVEWKPTPTRQA